MAAKGGNGESKTGLVVALLLFILLSLILGYTTYAGFAAVDEQAKKAQEADAKFKKRDLDADWYRAQALSYRSYMGSLPRDEKGDVDKNAISDLKVMRENFTSGKYASSSDPQAKGNTAYMQDLDKRYSWDPAKGTPVRTMADQIAQLEKQLKDAQTSATNEKERADDLSNKLAAGERALTAANKRFQEELGKNQKGTSDSLDKYEQRTKTLEAEIEKNNKEYARALNQVTDEKARLQQIVDASEAVVKKMRTEMGKRGSEHFVQVRRDLDKDLAKLEVNLEKLGAKKLPPLEERGLGEAVLAEVEPKGSIYQIDKSGEMPFIDLGTAHGLKTMQPFTVYGKGPDGRPLKDPKAKVEVIKVVGPRLAQVRVTEAVDPTRDPIVPGDLLVNPAWSPNQKVHVALAGVIDLTGDGRDSREEFMRVLRGQNVEVDAYLDLKDNRIMGQIGGRTDFLVVGDPPDGARRGVADRSGDAGKAMTEMEEQARKSGLRIIPLRKFLLMTGYRAPRGLSTEPDRGLIRATGPAGGTPPERRDVPKMEKPNGK